jgi:hypothetical protein
MMEYMNDRKRHSSEEISRKRGIKTNIIHDPAPGRDQVPSNIDEFHHSRARFPLSDYLRLDL